MPENHPSISLPCFYGVDIGGTNIKIGLLDDAGQVIAFESIPTNEPDGPSQAVQRAADTCRDLAAKMGISHSDVPYAGLGAPGPMCLAEGKFLDPVNLPHWHEFKVQQALSRNLEMPVAFVNDANAAAFGEYWIGSGAQSPSLGMFTLGTGVGGGVIVDGNLVNGVNSFGSELGHIIVDSRPDARICVWGGGKGHLEAYASASAVAARASEKLQAGATSCLSEPFESKGAVTAKDIYEAALADDQFALDLIDETAFYLGIGATGMIHSFDPGVVVLGGAMNFGGPDCRIGQRFLNGIKEEFHRRTFPNVQEGTEIKFATLGSSAGYIGAAGFARQAYHRHRNAPSH